MIATFETSNIEKMPNLKVENEIANVQLVYSSTYLVQFLDATLEKKKCIKLKLFEQSSWNKKKNKTKSLESHKRW